jgi:hypothetical protein
MRTGQPIISRPAWYDRNPIVKCDSWLGTSTAPHAETERWTYTVPAGKKAFLETLSMRMQRSSAASTGGTAVAWVGVYPSGGVPKYLAFCAIVTNTVGDKDSSIVGQAIVMKAGDIIRARTSDLSTGGAIDYFLAYKITEFDA